MTIAVIGLGSMGKRRIRLIEKYDKSIEIIGIDNNYIRQKECIGKYDIKTFLNLDEAIKSCKIESAFVCTPPLSHSDIITLCLQNNINVFSELNLVSNGYHKNMILAKQNNLKLFLSSTFLYREEPAKIIFETKKAKCLLNYTYHVGQYLPDWHPWENYKEYFTSQKRTNACREIFAIELPWLVLAFGEVEDMYIVKSRIGSLDIDYNDNYIVQITHKSGHKGVLCVDIISRKAVRNLEVFGENLYLSWDGKPTGLVIFDYDKKENVNIWLYDEVDSLENYSSIIVENAYYNEIVSYFEAIKNNKAPLYSFEKDLVILKLIDEIEDWNEEVI